MSRLGPWLMIAGAALLVAGLLGRFAFDGTEDDAGAPIPSAVASAEPSVEPSGQPSADPSAEPSAAPSVEPAETPEDFFALFAEAIRSGDQAFLLARLHPGVIELYGTRQCRAAVTSLATDPSFEVRVRSVEGPAPYDYAPDGQSVIVDEVFTIGLTFTSAEGTSRQEAHVAPVDGEMRWFTDCGDPLA